MLLFRLFAISLLLVVYQQRTAGIRVSTIKLSKRPLFPSASSSSTLLKLADSESGIRTTDASDSAHATTAASSSSNNSNNESPIKAAHFAELAQKSSAAAKGIDFLVGSISSFDTLHAIGLRDAVSSAAATTATADSGTATTPTGAESFVHPASPSSHEFVNRSIPYTLITQTSVFCNRELNMQTIQAVGFDMDYTLAQYTVDFDLLAYDGAREKLVSWMNYPQEVSSFRYQQDISRRGCIIDKSRGNIIKLDAHRYVHAVEHGLTALSSDQRKIAYHGGYREIESFTGKNFANIDTPFSLVDACLFAQLVDLKDRLVAAGDSNSDFAQKSYADLWSDMRSCVDRCHKDGVIKLKVAEDPSKYIIFDDKIFPMLEEFRRSGLKVFLLTNSLWDYTQVVMNFLEGKKAGEDLDFKWTEFFDLIVVGGNKPSFLLDERSFSIYKIDPKTHKLGNVENLPVTHREVDGFLEEHGKIYQGGNAQILHKLLKIPAGDRLLYVGDHIFSDVVRSKRSLGWRTCLIVPELSDEIKCIRRTKELRTELFTLRRQQVELERKLDDLYDQSTSKTAATAATTAVAATSTTTTVATAVGSTVASAAPDEMKMQEQELRQQMRELRKTIRERQLAYDYEFHPRWGQLFKAGTQESRISLQIQDYACIYTSKASNLGTVSPYRPFRPTRDMMAHDHIGKLRRA